MRFSRRHFLLAGGLLGGGTYINQRGLRFPRLGFEPPALPASIEVESARVDLQDCCVVFDNQNENSENQPVQLRAYTPSPSIQLQMHGASLQFEINNIAADARLRIDSPSRVDVQEQRNGIQRTVRVNNTSDESITLSWQPSEQGAVRFAVIGDTGGGNELDWCLERAVQLKAQFLLHLGDFNYSEGEYERAIEQFNNAAIPIYITIGNHDFNDSGLIYHKFRQQLGPMNNSFVIANTRFINIDSAANFFPPYSGHRGKLIRQLKKTKNTFSDQLFYTHRPFVDTREGHTHNMSGMGEIDWVQESMHELGVEHILCGHVHRSSRIEVNGIQQWIAGEGLGFEDIRAQKQVAQILIGEASASQKLQFEWHAMEMPWANHTSPTHLEKLNKQGLDTQLEWYLSWSGEAQTG